jgi:PAS domain-containing protein
LVEEELDQTAQLAAIVPSPIRTLAGVLIGASKVARDITAQIELEADVALKSALIELSGEAIFAWDLHGGIVEWNAGCCRILPLP